MSHRRHISWICNKVAYPYTPFCIFYPSRIRLKKKELVTTYWAVLKCLSCMEGFDFSRQRLLHVTLEYSLFRHHLCTFVRLIINMSVLGLKLYKEKYDTAQWYAYTVLFVLTLTVFHLPFQYMFRQRNYSCMFLLFCYWIARRNLQCLPSRLIQGVMW